jgi:hypothetical protein
LVPSKGTRKEGEALPKVRRLDKTREVSTNRRDEKKDEKRTPSKEK